MAIAINGTESPVDNSTGIPENIFKGTLETLDERNLRKFRMRMSGSHYKNLEGCFNTPDIDKLKSELEFILKSGHQRLAVTTQNGIESTSRATT